jgi:5-methylthioadenosine/S-adenosylhomocysteine deaminase
MVDGRSAHMQPDHDAVANLVYAAQSGDVRYTVVDGQILLSEGMICSFDERAVLAEAKVRAQKLLA